SDDFRRMISQTTGKNLDEFFDQWLHHAGYPEYDVRWTWQDGKARIVVRQEQSVDAQTPLFDLPIVIDFTFSDGRTQAVQVRVNQAQHELAFSLPQRPVLVRFDPGNTILKKLDFEKDADELRYQAMKDPDVIGRIRAVEALSRLSADEAVETLINVLQHD